MKKHFLSAITTFLFITVLGCKEQLIKTIEKSETPFDQSLNNLNARKKLSNDDSEMVLGRKLENPYSIENMKKAYLSLKKVDNSIKDYIIKENFLYVRFLPKNKGEFDILNKDESIDIFDYPLDYEIIKVGNRYKDKNLQNEQFSWYYCAIPIDFEFPKNFKYEILDKLFLPKGNGNDIIEKNRKTVINDVEFLDLLENESLNLTGNLTQTKKGRINSYIPSGTITMQDDQRGEVPVIGCKVQTRVWFSTETAITNNTGYFNIGVQYNNDANFSIKWSRADFDIYDSPSGQAYYNGPKQNDPWILNINNGKSKTFATVHRAAYEYYYNTPEALSVPPNTTFYVQDTDNQNSIAGEYAYSIGIRIWTRVDDANSSTGYRDRTSAETFGVVAHEIGHRVHSSINFGGFIDGDPDARRLQEAWGEALKWLFRMNEYGNCGDFNPFTNALTNDNFQGRIINDNGVYKPIFVDLFDDCNQRNNNCNQRADLDQNTLANDNVSGFTIKQFEDAIRNANRWNSARDYLFDNNPANPTRDNLTQLFEQWQ